MARSWADDKKQKNMIMCVEKRVCVAYIDRRIDGVMEKGDRRGKHVDMGG